MLYGLLVGSQGRHEMNFDDQVVLVTGSSRGLGNAFARCLAAAGATVVVNSTGTSDLGSRVAEDICAAGGKAVHIAGQVQDAALLVANVVEECGHIDGVVHNAGILHDKTLRKMTQGQWDAVLDIHLTASFRLAHAAWPHFEARGGGNLVLITSASGLYGNFGQANYAAAKAGMVGLGRSIALEGTRNNIRCNVVSPYGATEMNSINMDEDRKAIIKPEFIAPLVGYLTHPDCKETGSLFETSAGIYKKVRWERSRGLMLDTTQPLSIDDIARGWDAIEDFSESDHPANMGEALGGMVAKATTARQS